MTVRLKWPLELAGSSLATVEQDSDEDIVQCSKAILRHRAGDRTDIPQMGVPDFTFSERPLDLDAAQEVLRRHEPRADTLLIEDPDLINQWAAEVRAEWSRRGEASA
jgi:hypothetical protein